MSHHVILRHDVIVRHHVIPSAARDLLWFWLQ